MNWYKQAQHEFYTEDNIEPGAWTGVTVYHGTDSVSAKDIIENGIDINKCDYGYFGQAFYTTADANLAQSNYADMAYEEDLEDSSGKILTFKVSDNIKVLDLRDPSHSEIYTTLVNKTHGDIRNLRDTLTNAGIDALYDRSNDSFMVYNPNILTLIPGAI